MRTTLRHPFRAAATLVVLVALVTAGLLTTTDSPAFAAGDSGAEAEFVRLVNQERVSRGLPSLRVASDLVRVSRNHSQVMANASDLHHNPNLGSDVTNWRRLTENVGVGSSVSRLHSAFMASSGHRANILDSKVTEIGVGVEVRNGRIWVTKVFRLPATTTTSTAPAPTPKPTLTSVSNGSPAPLPAGRDVKPLTGDWDGNGSVTPGWFIDGYFHLSNYLDGSGPLISFRYGVAGDLPLVGDWDGNGTDTVGIVRDGEWHLINHHRGGRSQISYVYGRVSRGDIPMAGDWNGDGKDTPAIVRDGEWHFVNSHRGGRSDFNFVYGRVLRGDIPFVGDWNRDGIDTAGIIRDGEWHFVNSHRGGKSDMSFIYGRVSRGDIPVVGDWDADRVTEIGIIRDGTWHYRFANSGGTANLSRTWAP